MSTLSQEEFFELIEDKTKEGTAKLLEKFYGAEWERSIGSRRQTSDVIGGMAEMLWAHIEAPILAYNGDGAGAVDSAVGAVGALAGGVIGGVPGALIGKIIAEAPGWVIDYFDTTNPEFSIVISNVSKYHIRFSSNHTDYRPYTSNMYANIPSGRNARYNTNKLFIPKAVTYQKTANKGEQVIFSCPITVHSKWAYAGYQLEAVDDDGNVVKTYDIGFKYPGGWWGESHYVGVFENSGWPRRDTGNNECLNKVGKQTSTGKGSRPSQGSSGASKGWWENWRHCQFELA